MRSRYLALAAITALLSGALAAPARPFAQEKAPPPAKTPIDALRDYTIEMIDGMDEEQLRYIYEIRTRHGIGRAVDVVRRDIGNAVEQCGRKHPEMKTGLTGSFDAWKKAIEPLLEDSRASLKDAIANQKFVAPAKIDKLLSLVDKAGKYTEEQVEKEIVTTKEACTTLLNSMSDTRENLSRLLRETLSSVPVPAPPATEEKKEDAADKSEAP